MIAKAKIAGIVLATVAVITGGTTGAVRALSSYTVYDDFNSAKRGMYGSEYELSGNFDVAYTYSNISIDDGILTLKIDKNTDPRFSAGQTGGEYHTGKAYGYGYYEVSMIPIDNPGVVSSFFTFAGDENSNSVAEIDIEFPGNNTHVVDFNYYVNGIGNHGFTYDLGFDASEDFHSYGFLWVEDSITWFVDGIPVYRLTDKDDAIPSVESQIYLNAWTGSEAVKGWIDIYDGTAPLYAKYDYFSFTEQKKVDKSVFDLIEEYLPQQ